MHQSYHLVCCQGDQAMPFAFLFLNLEQVVVKVQGANDHWQHLFSNQHIQSTLCTLFLFPATKANGALRSILAELLPTMVHLRAEMALTKESLYFPMSNYHLKQAHCFLTFQAGVWQVITALRSDKIPSSAEG